VNPAATTYEIRVDRHLDDHWTAALGAMAIRREDDGTSRITACVADQAQLHGLLAGLRDLNVGILELTSDRGPGTGDRMPRALGG
jgi:hypothetical protein